MRRTIIAEIGLNHNGDMSLAKCLINEAKSAGADIAKFQFFDISEYFGPDFEWYEECMAARINFQQASELKSHCDSLDIEFMASAFNLEGVKWCMDLNVKRIKIASRCIGQDDLIQSISESNKDIIVSLGFWEKDELPKISTKANLDFLYCISKYPTMPSDLDFSKIDFLSKYSGFSDHTIGVDASLIALARGAKILEKHFTLSTTMHGPDHSGSCTPNQLKEIVDFARRCEKWT